MRINDYSGLFNNGNSNNGYSGSSFHGLESALGDYKSIKSGAYGKLMKSYYSQNDDLKSNARKIADEKTASKDSTAEITSLKDTSAKLSQSAAALYSGKNASLYSSDKTEELGKAVKTFVDDYNDMLKAAEKSENRKVTRVATNMVNSEAMSSKLLDKAGISINDDGTLKLDEDKLSKADKGSLKTLFSGSGSFAYNAGTAASFISSYATQDQAMASGTYNSAGLYGSYLGTGSLFDVTT